MMKVGVVLSRRLTCRAINGGRQVVHKPGGGPARAVPPRSPAHPRELGDNPDTYRHIQTGRSRAGGRGRGHLPLFRLGLVCFLRPHLPDTSAMFPSAGPSGRRLRMRPGHIRSGTYGRPSGSNSGPLLARATTTTLSPRLLLSYLSLNILLLFHLTPPDYLLSILCIFSIILSHCTTTPQTIANFSRQVIIIYKPNIIQKIIY